MAKKAKTAAARGSKASPQKAAAKTPSKTAAKTAALPKAAKGKALSAKGAKGEQKASNAPKSLAKAEAKPAAAAKSKLSPKADAAGKTSEKSHSSVKPTALKAAPKTESKGKRKEVELVAPESEPFEDFHDEPVFEAIDETEDEAQDAQDIERTAEQDSEKELGAEPEKEAEEKAAAPEKSRKKRDEVKIDRTGNLESQWKTLFEKTKGVKPVPYKMSENYEAKTPLMHKVLGWGYVLSSQNNRLEVLFKDGIKILIANYRA